MLRQIQMLCSKNVQNFQKTQKCEMSTLKQLMLRVNSIKNIRKITHSMKMVAAAKYARAQREMLDVRPFGKGAQYFYKVNKFKPLPDRPLRILIAIASDKGLCGGVHSRVCQKIIFEIDNAQAENFKIVCVGEKSVQLLQRKHAKNIFISARDIGKKDPTFLDATRVAMAILKSGYYFDFGKIFYNKARTVISFDTMMLELFSMESIKESANFFKYDTVDDEDLKSYLEFTLSALIFYAMKENITNEHASRMTTMDTATKNAKNILTDLEGIYNRTRQAKITKDLIEIIAGASAL